MSETARTPEPPRGFSGPRSERLIGELYGRSHAAEYGLTEADFAGILAGVAARYLPAEASDSEFRSFCRSLRVEELALARGCAAGNERAWDVFLSRYRERLYDAARAITREDSSARHLADSLYADLYGTRTREGRRASKLISYSGRGSLEGWLRTTLAQERVNSLRRGRREVSLEERSEQGAQFAAGNPAPAAAPDPRLREATDEALGSLPAEERFILASYYLDERTLAAIARALGVHESTACRKLGRAARLVRQRIIDGLVRRGLDRAQAEEALATDVRDVGVDVRGSLSQETAGETFSHKGGKQG